MAYGRLKLVPAEFGVLIDLHQVQFGNQRTSRRNRRSLLRILDCVLVLALDLLRGSVRLAAGVSLLVRRVLVTQCDILWQVELLLAGLAGEGAPIPRPLSRRRLWS